MPTNTLSDIATQQASGRGDTRISGSLLTGQRRVMRATYVCLGTEAASDTVTVGTPPNGAYFLGGRIWSEACGGTTGTIATLGTVASAGLLSATAVGITAAGSTALTLVAALPPAVFDGATAIVATLGLASGSFTAGKKVVFDIEYFV